MRRLLPVICFALALTPLSVQGQKDIATVAGGGPNNLPALKSSIGIPVGLALDSNGNLFIVDTHANRVYEVTAGTVTVFAGTGAQGYSGDTAAATAAQLSLPTGIFIDASNNIFIADSGNNVIREVANSTNIITTVAGNQAAGPGFSGDSGSPTAAQLNNPMGVFVDAAGDIFIADSGNNAIREVVAGAPPLIKTIAGSSIGSAGFTGDGGAATSATLHNPQGVALDGASNIFIADHDNNAIREVLASDKTIHTYAGSATGVPGVSPDGTLATAALLHSPSAVVVDSNGDVFIADTGNSIIREVTLPGKLIQTKAGNGTAGFGGDGGNAKQAQLSFPRGVFVDTSGNILISDTGNSFVRLVTALDGLIHQSVGNSTLSFSGDTFLATDASLSAPNGVAVNGVGDIFIADTSNNVIRRVLNSTGIIQTVAGIGLAGFGGNNSLATSALLNGPSDVFVDGFGNFFIADTNNNEIREVVAATGNIKPVAGNGTAGFSGDGGFAVNAQLSGPTGVFVDGSGNIFIADRGNNVIREVTAADSKIHTIAGNNTSGFSGDNGPAISAQLSAPAGVAVDAFGNVFIADTGNNVVREVLATGPNAGNIVPFAGNHTAGFSGDNGSPTSAQLNGPTGVVLDPSGDVFIADTKNHVVREVLFGGNIQTVAGNHTAGFSGDGGLATSAMLHSPAGIAVDTLGGLEIADTGNNRIRDVAGLVQVPAVTLSVATLTFNSQVIGSVSASQPVTVTNSGAAPMAIGNIGITDAATGAITTNFTQTNNCGVRLAAGANCIINVRFAPPLGGPFTANLNISDSAPGSPQVVSLTGTGVSAVVLAPTGLSFPLQINGTSAPAQSITLTNNQTVALNLIGSPAITIMNPSPVGSFTQQNTCGVSVAAGGTCTITVTFTPTATGANSATLVITDDAPGGSQSATLFGLGTGATATLSPTSLTFTTESVTTTSAAQTVTLTNGGKEALNISNIIFTGQNNGDFSRSATTCTQSLLPGANCTISVTFTPSAGGSRTASLTINDSAGDSPQSVTLSGTGLDFQLLVPSGQVSTATVTAGATANYNLQIAAVGGAVSTDSISVTITCGGAPTGATCNFPSAPIAVTPALSANFNITVSTTAAPAAFLSPRIAWPNELLGFRTVIVLFVLAMLAFLAGVLRMRYKPTGFSGKTFGWAAATALVIVLGMSAGLLTGCNKGIASGGSGGPPGTTPKGTYNITVTGKAGNDVHNFVVTLTVQ